MVCSKCGQSHEHQRVDYPLHTVVTFEDGFAEQYGHPTGALVDAQEVASEQSRLRAEAEGKLTEATMLLEHSDKRITELEAIVYRQAELLDKKGYTQQEAMLRFQQKRITELERQLTAIEVAASDGWLCAEGCTP